MTGYYVRILREGGWKTLDITELTDAELEVFLFTQETDKVKRWVIALARWIRENVRADERGESDER